MKVDNPKRVKIGPGPTSGPVRWGLAGLFGAGVASLFLLIPGGLGLPPDATLIVAVNLGGWSLVLSTIAFILADRRRARVNVLTGAFIGAATMALLLAGWETIGQTVASIFCGSVLGAVVAVPLGWTIRSARSRLSLRSGRLATPHLDDLRDPWIDP